jgi:hypothetical protein
MLHDEHMLDAQMPDAQVLNDAQMLDAQMLNDAQILDDNHDACNDQGNTMITMVVEMTMSNTYAYLADATTVTTAYH